MKPAFSLVNNIRYCFSGLINVVKEETSFKIHLVTFAAITGLLFFLSFTLTIKLILWTSFIFVLIGESINSAIERVVDLVSPEFHPLAKNAKDIGAFVVMLFYALNIMVWLTVLVS